MDNVYKKRILQTMKKNGFIEVQTAATNSSSQTSRGPSGSILLFSKVWKH